MEEHEKQEESEADAEEPPRHCKPGEVQHERMALRTRLLRAACDLVIYLPLDDRPRPSHPCQTLYHQDPALTSTQADV